MKGEISMKKYLKKAKKLVKGVAKLGTSIVKDTKNNLKKLIKKGRI